VDPLPGSELSLVDISDPVVRTEEEMEVTFESIDGTGRDAGFTKDQHFECHGTILWSSTEAG